MERFITTSKPQVRLQPFDNIREPTLESLTSWASAAIDRSSRKASVMGTLLPYQILLDRALPEDYEASLDATKSAHATVTLLLMSKHFPTGQEFALEFAHKVGAVSHPGVPEDRSDDEDAAVHAEDGQVKASEDAGTSAEALQDRSNASLVWYGTASFDPQLHYNAGEFEMSAADYPILLKRVKDVCDETLEKLDNDTATLTSLVGDQWQDQWQAHIAEYGLTPAMLRDQVAQIGASLSERVSIQYDIPSLTRMIREDKEAARKVLPGGDIGISR